MQCVQVQQWMLVIGGVGEVDGEGGRNVFKAIDLFTIMGNSARRKPTGLHFKTIIFQHKWG